MDKQDWLLQAIKQSPSCLEYASKALISDPVYMKKAIEVDKRTIYRLSTELKENRDFVLDISQITTDILRVMDPEFKNDKAIMRSIVLQRPDKVSHLGSELLGDRAYLQALSKANPKI